MAEVRRNNQENNVAGLAALYAGVSQNLTMIHAADDAIETKVAAYLAGSLVILTLVITKTETWRMLSFIGIGLLIISISLSVWALWSRNYDSVAVKVEDNPDYLDMGSKSLLLQLIADAEASFTKSNAILSNKVKMYRWILILFAAGTAVSLLSFYIKISWIR